MNSRPRSRPLSSKIILLTRAAARQGGLRLAAGLAVAFALISGASVGFALNQETPEGPVGLQGIWPDFPPESLSGDSFARLEGNWAEWGQAAAIDVAELYALAEKDLDAQKKALATIESRVRVLERALRDPAYSMIRDELTSVLVPLKLRAQLFARSLELVTGDAAAAAAPAREAAATRVRNALDSLESDLRAVPNGAAWLPYVKADEVRASIGTPEAAATLAGLPGKLDPEAEGLADTQRTFLGRPSFREFNRAISDYLAVTRIAEEGADVEALRERLAALIQAVDSHEESPTGEASKAIRDARTALRQAAGPLADSLDQLIRSNFLNYNLRLVADAPFLSKLVATQDVTSGPVVDQFMGANIRGSQTTRTNADLRFIPSEDSARFQLTLDGVANSRTNAFTHQATISSVGQHQFNAFKPITFDGDQFILGPAEVSVNPSIRHVGAATKYDHIFFGLFKGMIRNRAIGEANARMPASRAHAADEMRESLLPRFNSEVDTQFGGLNADLADFEERMKKQGVSPKAERVRTTSDRFLLDAAVRNDDETSGSPPNIGSTRGVGFTLQIHESLLNNAAARWNLAGRRMTDKEVKAELELWFENLLGRDLDFSTEEEERAPTTLIFNETDPIRFKVVDGAVVLILRAGIVPDDGEEIPAQLVQVPLNLSMKDGQINIERGTIIVAPVDPPESRARQIARAGVMRKKLEESIQGGTRDGVINIEREGRSPATIQIQRIDAHGGWLTIYGT